jgi:hypothetical protein
VLGKVQPKVNDLRVAETCMLLGMIVQKELVTEEVIQSLSNRITKEIHLVSI